MADFRDGSFFKRIDERVTALENSPNDNSLVNRITTNETRINDLRDRALSLETWRSNKSNALNDVTTATTGLSVDLLGVGVMASNGTKARLEEYGNKINQILAALRQREIITA